MTMTTLCDITDHGPVLLYDGACGFCSTMVQFVVRHDRRGELRFAPLQSAVGQRLLAGYPDLAEADSVVWVESTVGNGTRAVARSDAAFRVLRYLGGPWTALRMLALIPRPVRDRVYDLIARHRHRFPGGKPGCVVPPPGARHRFLVGEG